MKITFTDYMQGAGVATDLVNTSPVVRSGQEHLPDRAALADFLAAHGVVPGALADSSPLTGVDLTQVHALRQEIRAAIQAGTEDQAVDAATQLASRVGTRPGLYRDAHGAWQWCLMTEAGTNLADELAVLAGAGLLGVIRTLGHERFRPCGSAVCHGMFVDTSRAGRRRYCMPEICGNRINVAKHRVRSRSEREGAPGEAS